MIFGRRARSCIGDSERKRKRSKHYELPIQRQPVSVNISRSVSPTGTKEPERLLPAQAVSDDDWAADAPGSTNWYLNFLFAGARMLRDMLPQREASRSGASIASTLMRKMGVTAIYRKRNIQSPHPSTGSIRTC